VANLTQGGSRGGLVKKCKLSFHRSSHDGAVYAWYVITFFILLSNGECHGLGTSQVNSSQRFLSGGLVKDSVCSGINPLKDKKTEL